jgi:glucosamine--fructose-6-phosphate aminotransferase (isomerizing)
MERRTMSRLLGEIREQPEVLGRLVEREYPAIQELASDIRGRDIRYVLIAARGSSDNAATFAKYLLGTLNHLPVALAAPSMYTIYRAPPCLEGALVLAISQSGMSPDIVSVVREGRRQGALTVAITNEPDSTLAQSAERVIRCHAGQELSVAATKTYTAELMALSLLSVAMADDQVRLAQLLAIPDALTSTLTLDAEMATCADRYRYMTNCAVIARGYNYATAFEIALKLKELTYTDANPYSSADFQHGPIAVVDPGFPVVVIAPLGQVLPDVLQMLRELQERDAELVVISDSEEALGLGCTPLRLPQSVAEWLSPITAVVPGQLLAYYLALSKGLDPERPRGLRKVTETR